jgi:hypothetical protein
MGDGGSDEAVITSLIAQVQHMVDFGTLEEYLSLFTEDAVWVLPPHPGTGAPGDERRGLDDIRAGVEERRAAGVQGPGTHTRHLNTTTSVAMDGPDAAWVTSCFLYFTDTLSQPTLRLLGTYRHQVRRTDAGWKVARREISFT